MKSVNVSLTFSATGVAETSAVQGTETATVGGAFLKSVVSIATAQEQIFDHTDGGLGDVLDPGTVQITNLDAANYVEVGFVTGVYPLKIQPGQAVSLELGDGVDIFAKAHTAAVRVLIAACPK